jgi:uncharacterized protein YukE
MMERRIMAFEWLIGVITNIFSNAIWDGAKRFFGEGDSRPIQTLGLELAPDSVLGPEWRAADLATLNRIQALLPTDTILYLRDHSFGFAHRGAYLEPLDRFLEQTRGPEDQFLSSGLERLRQGFRTAVATFQNLVAKNTFRSIQADMYEIPEEWERDGSGRYFKAADELNAAATMVVRMYDELVQIARKELLR